MMTSSQRKKEEEKEEHDHRAYDTCDYVLWRHVADYFLNSHRIKERG